MVPPAAPRVFAQVLLCGKRVQSTVRGRALKARRVMEGRAGEAKALLWLLF